MGYNSVADIIEDLHANSNFRRIILYAAILGVWRKLRGIYHYDNGLTEVGVVKAQYHR